MFDKTALDAYVKRTYDPKRMENMLSGLREPCYGSLSAKTDGSGDNFSWLADNDDAYNGSPDFSEAQTGASSNTQTVGGKYLSSWNAWSAVAQLTSEIIGQTRNDDGAWARAYDVAFEKTSKGVEHINAVFFQGRGWGEVSQVTSVSGSTFKPKIASDITKYVKGMPLVGSVGLNNAVLRSATRLWVTAVTYTPGSELVTLSGALSGPGIVNDDWVFIAGARQNSATPARIALTGMGAWFPNQASGNIDMADATITTLLGVTRSSNSRNYGTFIDATGGGSIVGGLLDGVTEAVTVGGAKKLRCFCSKKNFADLAKDLQNAVRYADSDANKGIGTSKLTLYTDGEIEATLQISRVVNDNIIWGFDPAQVVKKSIGNMPHIDKEDGLTIARIYNSAGYESRLFQQAIFQFKNPAGGLRVQVGAVAT